jgi:hypothetical protein
MGHNAGLPAFGLRSVMASARIAPQREKLTQGIASRFAVGMLATVRYLCGFKRRFHEEASMKKLP